MSEHDHPAEADLKNHRVGHHCFLMIWATSHSSLDIAVIPTFGFWSMVGGIRTLTRKDQNCAGSAMINLRDIGPYPERRRTGSAAEKARTIECNAKIDAAEWLNGFR